MNNPLKNAKAKSPGKRCLLYRFFWFRCVTFQKLSDFALGFTSLVTLCRLYYHQEKIAVVSVAFSRDSVLF